MKQEDRQLLLKDLSARLPYNPMVYIHELGGIDYENYLYADDLDRMMSYSIRLKPYLRPMSSMTEEELFEVQNIIGKGVEICYGFISIIDSSRTTLSYLELQAVFDYLNSIHVDYRGLIPMGLAIEVTKENNPYEE